MKLKYLIIFILFFSPSFAGAATIGKVQSNYIGLVGYWTLDGSQTNWATGKTLDSSGQGNSGDLILMSTTTSPALGWVGGALNFDGVSSQVIISATNILPTGSPPYSICNWFNAATINPTNTYAGFVGVNAFNAPLNGVVSGIKTGGVAYVDTFTTEWNPYSGFVAGKWYHTCLTSNGSSQFYYVNGAFQASRSETSTFAAGTTVIGYAKFGSRFYNGIVDDVRIYNRTLQPNEIKQLYNTGSANTAHSNTASNSGGLVGYWTLDGSQTNWATGKTLDSSGQGNTGSLITFSTSTSPAVGQVGGALNFDGVGSFINPSTSFGQPSQITISAWFKTASLAGEAIFGQAATTPPAVPGSFIPAIAVTTGGLLRGELWTGGIGGITSASSVADNKWHHAVLVGSTTVQFLYLDGVFVGSRSGTISQSWWTTTQIGTGYDSAGRSIGAGWRYFNGSIDDVRVYNRAFQSNEIKQLYNTGSANTAHSNTASNSSGLVGYWTLDGSQTNWATGKTLDSSGQGNSGNLILMSTTTSPVVGQVGGALKFTGASNTGNEVSIGDTAVYDLSGNASISLWIKPIQTFWAGSYTSLIAKRSGVNNNYEIYLEVGTGKLGFYNGSLFTSNYIPPVGSWTHITAVVLGTTCYLYVNGAPLTTFSSCGFGATNNAPVEIGYFTSGGADTQQFVGSIDNVRIYNRALSPNEILQLYNSEK